MAKSSSPRHEQQHEPLYERGRERPAAATERHARQTLVLVVDDDQAIAELLVTALEDAGYLTLTASNGRTACTVARAMHPDVILTDYTMPQLNGEQLVRALREQRATRDIPIVLMSSARPGRERLQNVSFLAKPFDLDDVLEIVARHTRAPNDKIIH